MTVYSSIVFFRFSTILNNEIITVTSYNLGSYLEKYEHNTKMAAFSAAYLPDLISAVSERSTEKIFKALDGIVEYFDVSYFTVTDTEGYVLARTHMPSLYGDLIASMQNIEDALDGKISTYYESGAIIALSVHTGAPVYGSNGEIIGVISAGVRLDENESVDRLKQHFNADFSVFLGNTRIATTIVRNGERITSTQSEFNLSPDAFEEGFVYINYLDVMGESYNAFLHPIVNSKNEIFAMMVVGVSNSQLFKERNRLIINNTIICLVGLIVSFLILFQIVSRLTKPINRLAALVAGAAQGSLNIKDEKTEKMPDEISSLSSDVFSLVEQLRDSANKAQMASVTKSVFLANMSHEIRTPMNSIMGFSELALDDDIPQRTRDYLVKILENTEGLLQIINDILDISKVESGKMDLEKIPFNIHELFTGCRTLVMPKAVEKGIMLHFFAEPSIGKMLLGDPTRMRQILVNLLSNAVKFTNTGTVNLYAEIKNMSENTVTMHFEVKDSGIGMTSEQIEKIFDPFTQAETGTTRQYGGTGLGLSITRNILELMGSSLFVESTPGLGSKFSFTLTFDTLDATDDDLYHKKVLLNELEKPVFKGDVLLCEDNPMNQQVICEHLTRIGLKPTVAWNGRIGFDMIRRRILSEKKQFDLIFMDIHMPVMDGIQAAKQIREIDANIPIIAMTANVMADERNNYMNSGMLDCICKPFTSQELWHCLLKYLKPVNYENKPEEKTETESYSGAVFKTDDLLEADAEYQKTLQAYFVKSYRNKFNEIMTFLDAGDISSAHRLAHTLKGNAAQLGKKNLQNAALNVERNLRNGENHATKEQLAILENELNLVLDELELANSENKSKEEQK
jgi:signal transduction histidine kinase/CheY-like chemotaxis protein